MKFRDILILAGGKNEEHEISIMTSKEVFKILCQLGYKVEILNVDPSTFEKEITKYMFEKLQDIVEDAMKKREE